MRRVVQGGSTWSGTPWSRQSAVLLAQPWPEKISPVAPASHGRRLSTAPASEEEGDDIAAAVAAWRNKPDKGALRFPVGAPVKCLVGPDVWAQGTVVKHNHREPGVGTMPYQVMVSDEHTQGEKNAVWAPAVRRRGLASTAANRELLLFCC